MNYQKFKNHIEIYDTLDFCPTHILECGQIFCYKKVDDTYFVYPEDKVCKIVKTNYGYSLLTKDVSYFENFFDLQTDYQQIKEKLHNFKEMEFPLKFGNGIRILKQDLLEIIISFMISANNNIKRIQKTLNLIREHFGHKITFEGETFYAFPSLSELETLNEEFFKSVGAGYRSEYLTSTIKVLKGFLKQYGLENSYSTKELKNKLISLKGIGPKVADCILLFAYSRQDVFPVDTWIKKVYADIFGEKISATKMAENLVARYRNLSGYAQQYLFYSKRENKKNMV